MKLCECGCGEPTKIAGYTKSAQGWVKGQPVRFLKGHHRRLSGAEYVVDPETGCWVWQRSITDGYGRQFDGERVRGAHRISYERHVGPIPEGMQIDHLCRNRACVNPEHLEVVTNAVNVQRGDSARLTPTLVREIRRRYAGGEGVRGLARDLGVSSGAVGHVVYGDSWLNVA